MLNVLNLKDLRHSIQLKVTYQGSINMTSIFWDINPITKSFPEHWILAKCFWIDTFEQRLDSRLIYRSSYRTDWNGEHHDIEGASGWQGSTNWYEGTKIGSSISQFNNDGEIDKVFQAGVINAISSIQLHQTKLC